MDEQKVTQGDAYTLTARERTSIQYLVAMVNATKAKVFDAQAALQAAQDKVAAAQRDVFSIEQRLSGTINGIIDSRELNGQWRLNESLTAFVKPTVGGAGVVGKE